MYDINVRYFIANGFTASTAYPIEMKCSDNLSMCISIYLYMSVTHLKHP